jgi:hypothetical protein
MLMLAGATPMDIRVAVVTVRVVDPETLPRVAVTVVDPETAAVASPLEPELLLTDATVVADELQVTEAVRSCVELSV